MERLELAPLYDVVGKESKGIFLGANDFTLSSEKPSQYCYLAPWSQENEMQKWYFIGMTYAGYYINPTLLESVGA